MRIRLAVPDVLDDHDRKAALDAALESVTRTVTGLVRGRHVPPAAGMIKSGRVKWHPEPPGDEHFDLPQTVIRRGHGDCDDLAPWHAGSLRASGIDPGAQAIVRKSGPERWHAIVRRSDGAIEDPSAHAGMGKGVSGTSVVGAGPAMHAPMTEDGRLCLAICPSRDRRHPLIWFARCDAPDKLAPFSWSATSAASSPVKSLLHSIRTVRGVVGVDLDLEDNARLAAVHDLVMGADPEEVADALDEICGDMIDVEGCVGEALHSVGFFGDLLKAVAKPLTSAVQFVKDPSLKSAASMFTSPLTAPLDVARKVYHIPGLKQVLQTGIPIAASAFGGPFGAAGGALATQLLEHGVPSSFGQAARMAMSAAPSMIPGGALTSMLPGGGGGLLRQAMPLAQSMFQGGGGGGAPRGIPLAQLAQLLAQHTPQGSTSATMPGLSRYLWERGKMVRPYPGGPAVMRF